MLAILCSAIFANTKSKSLPQTTNSSLKSILCTKTTTNKGVDFVKSTTNKGPGMVFDKFNTKICWLIFRRPSIPVLFRPENCPPPPGCACDLTAL